MGKLYSSVRLIIVILVFSLCSCVLAVSSAAADETSYSTPFPWNGHTMQVSYALDDGTVKSGHAAAGEKSVQVFLVSPEDTLSWDELMSSGQYLQLQALDGTQYGMVSSGFEAVEGSSRNITDLATNQYVGFSPIFDVPADIGLDQLVLVVLNGEANETTFVSLAGIPAEEQPAETAIPAELVGSWNGVGTQAGGGSEIALSMSVNADGTGEYTFEQSGYTESYPFTLESDSKLFSVSIPADNQLGITACEGQYDYADGILTLHITTTFSSGRQFEYTVYCVKAEP